MKMAKPTPRDIEAAGELLGILETINCRFGGPWPTDGPASLDEALKADDGNSVAFDADNRQHLKGLYNSLAKLLRTAPNFHNRVIGGMCYVILYDMNQIVDPDADTLEMHPRFALLEQQRDALLSILQYAIDIMTPGRTDGPTYHHIQQFLEKAKRATAEIKGPWCCENGHAQGKQVCDECAEINAGYQGCMAVSETAVPALVFYPAGSLGEPL